MDCKSRPAWLLVIFLGVLSRASQVWLAAADALESKGSPYNASHFPEGWSGQVAGHMPVLAINGAKATVTVNHGMSSVHFIDTVYVRDQNGAVVHMKTFDGSEANAQTAFAVPSGATTLTAYEHCNLHGLWAAAPQTIAQLGSGAKVCLTGYVMDKYCSERGVLPGGGTTQTLEHPELHFVHCLVDDARCYTSGFEVLAPAATGDGYCRAFDLGSAGTAAVLALARAQGKGGGRCSSCTGAAPSAPTRGFRATVAGTVATAATGGAAAVLENVQALAAGAACPAGYAETVAPPVGDVSLCLQPPRQLAQCGGSGSIDASVDFDVKRHVSWSIDAVARNITLTLSFGGAVPGAFLAAALNLRAEPHPMANADVVLVTVGGGGDGGGDGGGAAAGGGLLAVHDMWSAAVGRVPRRDDAFGDGRGSLEVLRSSLVGGQAEVVVRRPLGADDPRDVAIGAGSSMRLSFAHSSAETASAAAAAAAAAAAGSATGGFVYHGRRAGSYQVDFFSGLASRQQTSAVRKLKALHGVLMAATWALFVVAGVFAHRYFPAQKKQHRKIMASAAGGGTVVGVLIAQLFTTSSLGSDHAVRGFSLLCCAIAQGAVGSYIWRYDGIVDRHAAKAKMAAFAADGDAEGRRPKKAGCLSAALIKLDTALYGVAQGDGVARTANVRAAHPFLGCALFLAAQWQIASGLKAFGAEPWMSKALYAWWACVAALTFQLEKRKGEASRLAAARASNAREPEEEQQEELEDDDEEEEQDPIVRPAGNVSLHHARRFVV